MINNKLSLSEDNMTPQTGGILHPSYTPMPKQKPGGSKGKESLSEDSMTSQTGGVLHPYYTPMTRPNPFVTSYMNMGDSISPMVDLDNALTPAPKPKHRDYPKTFAEFFGKDF